MRARAANRSPRSAINSDGADYASQTAGPCTRRRRQRTDPTHYKHETETYAKRLAVIDYLRSTSNMTATLGEFYPGATDSVLETKRKSIYLWRSQRERIEKQCATSAGANQRVIRPLGTATVLPKNAEEEIVLWVKALREDGVPISAFMLQQKALEVARSLGISKALFTAKWMFRTGFMRRHALSLRRGTRQGQIPPADAAKTALEFKATVLERMALLGVDRVFNADQTAVYFEYLPKVTLNSSGQKTVWVRCGGKEKERVTVMLLGDSNGAKCVPFVVCKAPPSKITAVREENRLLRHGFGLHVWKEALELQADGQVQVYTNQHGWWNSDLSIRFLQHHFSARGDMTKPVLLLWDDFSAHWTDDVKAHALLMNVQLLKVPAGCTGVCQPADISWNYPLKTRLRADWQANLKTQLAAPREPGTKFKLQPPTRKMVVQWVKKAWAGLSGQVIKSGFKFIFRQEQQDDSSASAPPDSSDIVAQLESLGLVDAVVGEVSHDDDCIDGYFEATEDQDGEASD